MVQCLNEISKFLSDNPVFAIFAVNIALGFILWLSIVIAQKFVLVEFRKVRKVKIDKFDKVIIIFVGVEYAVLGSFSVNLTYLC